MVLSVRFSGGGHSLLIPVIARQERTSSEDEELESESHFVSLCPTCTVRSALACGIHRLLTHLARLLELAASAAGTVSVTSIKKKT